MTFVSACTVLPHVKTFTFFRPRACSVSQRAESLNEPLIARARLAILEAREPLLMITGDSHKATSNGEKPKPFREYITQSHVSQLVV